MRHEAGHIRVCRAVQCRGTVMCYISANTVLVNYKHTKHRRTQNEIPRKPAYLGNATAHPHHPQCAGGWYLVWCVVLSTASQGSPSDIWNCITTATFWQIGRILALLHIPINNIIIKAQTNKGGGSEVASLVQAQVGS